MIVIDATLDGASVVATVRFSTAAEAAADPASTPPINVWSAGASPAALSVSPVNLTKLRTGLFHARFVLPSTSPLLLWVEATVGGVAMAGSALLRVPGGPSITITPTPDPYV